MNHISWGLLGWIILAVAGFVYAEEVPTINNPLDPPVQRVVQMEEVWRIGDNGDEDFLLGVIGKVIRDAQGCFYLLDTQQSEVFKFSPEGQYLKSISRNGEGPGEINMCYSMVLWDENTIACNNAFPQQLVMIDLEGIPKDSLSPTTLSDFGENHRPSIYSFHRRDGFMVGSGAHHLYTEGDQSKFFFLSAFDDQANEVFCFDQRPTGYNFRKPIKVDEEADFLPFHNWLLGNGGEVYVATNRKEFFIKVFDFEGKLKRIIQREWPLVKRTKEEIEAAKMGYSFGASGMEIPPISYDISDYPLAIGRMLWHDNQLWVQTPKYEQILNDQQSFSFDIFDPEGNLLEGRTYLLPADPREDQIHWLDGGLAAVVTNVRSARTAAIDSDMKIQHGEGGEEVFEDEGAVLEVVLFKTVN